MNVYVKVRNDLLKVVAAFVLGFACLVGYQLYQNHQYIVELEAQQQAQQATRNLTLDQLAAIAFPASDAHK
jgi:predicted negative regulator of RcsB-dependent stress response